MFENDENDQDNHNSNQTKGNLSSSNDVTQTPNKTDQYDQKQSKLNEDLDDNLSDELVIDELDELDENNEEPQGQVHNQNIKNQNKKSDSIKIKIKKKETNVPDNDNKNTKSVEKEKYLKKSVQKNEIKTKSEPLQISRKKSENGNKMEIKPGKIDNKLIISKDIPVSNRNKVVINTPISRKTKKSDIPLKSDKTLNEEEDIE
mmetsp:Transcript_71370/g.154024  ORF Transcript_71370/g.154024 Transcript_71370/m.154024 type:complete len:203 (+) Transcript_71370:662-1270(+)